MSIIGNFFLGLSTLLTFYLFWLTYFEKMPGGDAAVGYAWAIIFSMLALWACLIVVAAVIGWQGGFAWVGSTGTSRFFLVAGSLAVSVVSAGLLFFFSDEPSISSGFIKTICRVSSIAIPVLLIFGATALLNSASFPTIPATTYKAPIIAGAAAGWASGLLLLILWGIQAQKNAVARMEEAVAFEDRNHLQMLQEIDSCDVAKDMVFILVFTDANQQADVRERALAKIMTRSDWQEELIRRLENGWAEQSFIFLASNEVSDKNLFPEPVRKGILNQAEIIRDGIRRSSHSSHFYPDRFCWEIERVLRTVQRFENMGIDYRPAIRELRAALDEPTDIEKTPFRCASLLDKWLQDHQ